MSVFGLGAASKLPRNDRCRNLRGPAKRIASADPGSSLIGRGRVPSGVRSRGPMPVPPRLRNRVRLRVQHLRDHGGDALDTVRHNLRGNVGGTGFLPQFNRDRTGPHAHRPPSGPKRGSGHAEIDRFDGTIHRADSRTRRVSFATPAAWRSVSFVVAYSSREAQTRSAESPAGVVFPRSPAPLGAELRSRPAFGSHVVRRQSAVRRTRSGELHRSR